MPSIAVNIRHFLTSKYWLLLTLYGAFFSFFALNRGGVDLFFELSILFFLVNLFTGNYRVSEMPISLIVVILISAYLLLTSALIAPEHSHTRWLLCLLRMLGAVLAIHCLSQKTGVKRLVSVSFPIVLFLAICWQFADYYFYDNPYGTFTNRHYLAIFTALALPIVFYFFRTTVGCVKWIFVPLAVLDMYLLLQTGSRPAILGIAFSIIFISIILVRSWKKWLSLVSVFLVFLVLYVTQYASVFPRIKNLVVNLPDEERVEFLLGTGNKILNNSISDSLFGHGIAYLPTTRNHGSSTTTFVFPHIMPLELLYLSGIIGTFLVLGGFLAIFVLSVKKVQRTRNPKIRLLFICLLITLLVWGIHCGLTVPFYSKYSLYPLSFILPVLLLVTEKAAGG